MSADATCRGLRSATDGPFLVQFSKGLLCHFYAHRDAMLTRGLAMTLCPSVCLSVSVTRRCYIETTERIELVFGMVASSHLRYTVLKANSGIFKNKDKAPPTRPDLDFWAHMSLPQTASRSVHPFL